MSLKGPHRTQPPPVPRGMVTAPPERLCSPGLYSPSPERELSLQSKRGLAFRFSDHNGQFQYLVRFTMGLGVVSNEWHSREMSRVTTLFPQGFLPEPEEVTVPWEEQTTKVDIECVVDMGAMVC
jgi:hypothetical protein